jgi:5-formyltetrahydrofolate cyclo-ligase
MTLRFAGFRFATKDAARRFVWECLADAGQARESLPPQGRIPNFAGARIPPQYHGEAATRATQRRWAEPVALDALPRLHAIVAGSAAVTPARRRCGKGAGYSDLEYGILRELGHPPVPVATTVHDLQVVDDFPVEPIDQPLTLICTPRRTIRVSCPGTPPVGIDWSQLDAATLAAMPVLTELRALQARGEAGR